MNIVVVDYGIGNVQSIFNALSQFKDINITLTDKKSEILNADGIILPGVGAFRRAMEELNKRNLPNILKKYIREDKPLLGICLGMQLLFESSEEFGHTEGLGFIKGKVVHFPNNLSGKLPHVGWKSLIKQEESLNTTLFKGAKNDCNYYFVHSYICIPGSQDIITSKTEYSGINFCSSIQQGNMHACQFHPEKSANDGLNILKNFIEIVKTKNLKR